MRILIRRRYPLMFAFACLAFLAFAKPADARKPRIRTITAFVRLDRANFEAQTKETLKFLEDARRAYREAGYEVQYIRLTTQPFPEYIKGLTHAEAMGFFRKFVALLPKDDFMVSIGPAMQSDSDDLAAVELLKIMLPDPTMPFASIVIAGPDGVYWKAVRASAQLVKHLGDNSKQGEANFAFAASAMVPLGTPFYPVSYHLGAGRQFAVALESSNVLRDSFMAAARNNASARQLFQSALDGYAAEVEKIAGSISQSAGWEYLGMDLSIAPGYPEIDTSIGDAVEKLTGKPFGSSGTMSAVAVITEVIRSVPVKQIGYSGLMLPVLEDVVLAKRWAEGRLTIDMILAYSAVCGTGLDTVPLPGAVTVEQLERIIGDVATLAFKLKKPLAARLMPNPGAKAGQKTNLPNWLLQSILQPLP